MTQTLQYNEKEKEEYADEKQVEAFFKEMSAKWCIQRL